jgi:seryl-tRNA synthetase
MIDPAIVREHLDEVRTAYRNRGLDADSDLEQLATLETRRRRLIPEIEGLKREQNTAGDEVARAKRQGQDASPLFAAKRARNRSASSRSNSIKPSTNARRFC